MRTSLLTSGLLLFINQLSAVTFQVGVGRTYYKPSQVVNLVQDGDVVEIDAGTYTADVCKWTKNNLTLKGVGGLAHLNANFTSSGGKPFGVIAGNNTTVENIEFSNCHDLAGQSMNWAGIRQEGINLTVRNCYFHDNDNGILAGDNVTSDALVEYTEFNHNGYGDGYSHNFYFNHLNSVTIQHCYMHLSENGHEAKCRAHRSYFLYNRITSETGNGNYEINLPNGGIAVVMGNMIQQSANSGNGTIVDYGSEGYNNPTPNELYVVNNTIVNDRSAGTFVRCYSGAALIKAYNNILTGSGTFFNIAATTIDTAKNWTVTNKNNVGLLSLANYDYHLQSSSKAINKGAPAGQTNAGMSLTPAFEYVHKVNKTSRPVSGTIDIGAYEYAITTGIDNEPAAHPIGMYVYADPTDNTVNVFFTNVQADKDVFIYDITGKIAVAQTNAASNKISFNKNSLAPEFILFAHKAESK